MQNIEEQPITRENVLALDVAEHCGYYSTHECGVWNFTQRKGKDAPEQHGLFYDTLTAFIRKYGIRQVVAEDVCVSKHFVASRKLSELRGVLCAVCAREGLPQPVFLNVTTIKKWATGDGKADKKKMMEYCQKRWGIDVKGKDDLADAIHIFKYYVRKYQL